MRPERKIRVRKRRLAFTFAIAFAVSSCGVAKYAQNTAYPTPKSQYVTEGTLREVFYPSTEPRMTLRRAYVYLPKGYESSDARYPVLYLLHGARGNETVWIDKAEILRHIDSLTACGAMLPTIVVLPNMNQYGSDRDYGMSRLKGAMESFFEVDGTVEKAFVHDVVATTDSLFRTVPEKSGRAIAGLSIGGMQSMYISANSSDTFAYVGMFSPMVHNTFKPGRDNRFYRGLHRKQVTQFADPPELYMIRIGRKDFFYPVVKGYCRSLDRRGYEYDVAYSEGGHQWYNWEPFCVEFLTKLWK